MHTCASHLMESKSCINFFLLTVSVLNCFIKKIFFFFLFFFWPVAIATFANKQQQQQQQRNEAEAIKAYV